MRVGIRHNCVKCGQGIALPALHHAAYNMTRKVESVPARANRCCRGRAFTGARTLALTLGLAFGLAVILGSCSGSTLSRSDEQTFTPRTEPAPDAAAAAILARIPSPALVEGSYFRGDSQEPFRTYSGYVDLRGECLEDMTVLDIREEGDQEHVVRRAGDGTTYVRITTGEYAGGWQDANGLDVPVAPSWVPGGFTLGNARGAGTCALSDLSRFTSSNGDESVVVDFDRFVLFGQGRADALLARVIEQDPTKVQRRVPVFSEMQRTGIHEPANDPYSIDVEFLVRDGVDGSVTLEMNRVDGGEVTGRWTFTPTAERLIEVPDGVTAWVAPSNF